MFAPCPTCRRHVRVDERACPFCSSALATLAVAPDTDKRMSRAKLFVFATTVGLSAATFACPKETDGGGGGGIVQPYGAPPIPPRPVDDAGANEQPETTAIAPPATIEPPAPTIPNTAPTPKPTFTPGAPVAMYGAPAPPPAQTAPTPKPGPGGPAAAYGAPPSMK